MIDNFKNVDENNDFIKDDTSGVIINNNTTEYHNARIRAGKHKFNETRLNKMETDISTIKQLLQDIKNG